MNNYKISDKINWNNFGVWNVWSIKIDDVNIDGNESKGRLNVNKATRDSERMWKAVNDLYWVVSRVMDAGQDIEIGRIREKFPEFASLNDEVLWNMIKDTKDMVINGDNDLRKLKDAYPELQ